MIKQLFRRKDIRELQAEALNDTRLRRALGPGSLTALGIGAIVGAGIFTLTGVVAANHAGPAVVLSFVLAGVASVFAALCYSEFASLVPMSGSAYTYAYATLGEFFAWIIGWDLILEYAVGAVTVSIGWSGYVCSLLRDIGIHIPITLSGAYGTIFVDVPGKGWIELTSQLTTTLKSTGLDPTTLPHATALFNLPAVVIVALITTLLIVGIRESAFFNNIIVVVKIVAILLFVAGAAMVIETGNWIPFIPENKGTFGEFGWSGILRGAGMVFFAYVGFDAVSTAAQEAKNPQKDMPIGIIGSLIICTILYILVAGAATGIMSYTELGVPDPLAVAADKTHWKWMAKFIKVCAIGGLASVILVMLLGQSRVLFSMSSEGLLPAVFSRTHPRFHTPWINSLVTGIVVAVASAVFTIREAGELVSIGTLLAFVIVAIGVLELRMRHPELHRSFKAPAIWFVAPAAAIFALILMLGLPLTTWIRLFVWLIIGLVIYFSYGIRNSTLAKKQK